MRILVHDIIEQFNGCEHVECHGLAVLCKAYLLEWHGLLKIVQVTMKHDPFDAM